MSTFADLLPREIPDQARAGLQALAAAGDARRAELGAQLAQAPPQWARESLGPVPDDPTERAAWEQRAGRAGAYREWVGHDDPADALGPAPAAGLVEKHAIYRDAHAALDLPDAGADEEQASEGLLRARVTAWEREQRWAPRYVADELDATHESLRRHRADATLWTAHADAAPDPHEAQQLRDAADQARTAADRLAGQVGDLERADAARAAWTAETAVTRDKAERGRAALGLRGIDLDAPHEQVTAREWLDAEDADRLAGDTDREIREDYELDQPAPDHTSGLDQSAPAETSRTDEPARPIAPPSETRVPDIRETTVRDDGERADPAERRRVPTIDDTTATADRAHLATVEITNRGHLDDTGDHSHDAAHDLDDERRDDLNRWATDDDNDDRWDAEPASEHDFGDADVLER